MILVLCLPRVAIQLGPGACAKGLRRRTWRSRLTPSPQTPNRLTRGTMAHSSSYEPSSGIEKWIDARLPVPRLMYDQFLAFPTPRNLNYWWTFGGILAFCLSSQIATGVVLAMHYVPTAAPAPSTSVEHIMRDVNYGWLIRYIHANGASMFFLAVYIHIFRGIYYGSYKAPREVLWLLGVLIYLLMMATAFMGYVTALGPDELLGARR